MRRPFVSLVHAKMDKEQGEPCVRSGFCCKVATCAVGVSLGEPARGCSYLQGDAPGAYSCQLVKTRPELTQHLGIGGGCSSPMFNKDRQTAMRREDDGLE